MILRRAVLPALALSFLLASSPASAGPDEVCIGAANEAEILKKDVTKLTKARERLRTCAAENCQQVIRDDCRQALAEIDLRIPTVVLIADDGSGTQVFDVSVTMDGAPLIGVLDGKPIAADGGVHTFTFQRLGLPPLDVRLVLVAGQKNVEVLARFPKPLDGTPPSADSPPPASPVSEQPQPSSRSSLPTVGLVVAGVGALGLGIGTFFGVGASSKQSDAHCPNNRCASAADANTLRDAKSAGNLSTAFFLGGALLAVGGLTIFFTAPKGSSRGASARLRPTVGPTAAALVIEGVAF